MSARFSKPELQKGNLLACPFWKSDPDRYKSQNNCHPDEGFPSVARVSEHVWRCHAPLTQCEYCGRRWSWQGRAEKVMQSRARHVPECQAAHNGELRRVGYGEPEIMTADQQEAFRRVRTLRKPEHKFSELYLALGKPLPETYRRSTPTLAFPLLTPSRRPGSLPPQMDIVLMVGTATWNRRPPLI